MISLRVAIIDLVIGRSGSVMRLCGGETRGRSCQLCEVEMLTGSGRCQNGGFLHPNGDIGKMTLIRLCAAKRKKRWQERERGRGMKDWTGMKRGSHAGQCFLFSLSFLFLCCFWGGSYITTSPLLGTSLGLMWHKLRGYTIRLMISLFALI